MTFREMEARDIARCIEVRTSVRENSYSAEALAQAGITKATVAAMLASTHKGWVCEVDQTLVGFSMADQSSGEFWVVAVLPEFEGLGIGRRLAGMAVHWLQDSACPDIWLWTSPDVSTRAFSLYQKLGWQDCGVQDGRRMMRFKTGT